MKKVLLPRGLGFIIHVNNTLFAGESKQVVPDITIG